MHKEFWQERWDEGRIGFHEDQVHPDLIAKGPDFLSGGPHRVLVPLAGKTRDIEWLLDRGHEVIAVEFVERAIADFLSQSGIEANRIDGELGLEYRAAGLRFVCGDFFALAQATSLQHSIDRIWDRAALIAVEPGRRPDYAATLRALARPGAQMLLNTLDYDQSIHDGPPWSVPPERVEELYPQSTLLHRIDSIEGSRWQERGHRYFHNNLFLVDFP